MSIPRLLSLNLAQEDLTPKSMLQNENEICDDLFICSANMQYGHNWGSDFRLEPLISSITCAEVLL